MVCVVLSVFEFSLVPSVKANPGIVRVQGNARGANSGTTTSITVTMASTPTSGNVLVAVIGYGDAAISSITETGVTWTHQVTGSATYQHVEIWLGTVGAGASTTITITFSAAVRATADVCEYSGVATSSFLDKTASATGTSTSTSTGTTGTTTQADELWVGGIEVYNTQGYTQGSPTNGFTLLDGANTNNIVVAFLEKIVSATGSANSGTTVGLSSVWAGCIATFKAVVDATPPTYSLPATPYNETRAGYAARFDCLWNDNTNVTTSYFCTNNTGVWSNSSVTMVWVNTTAAWANYTITLNSTVGVVVAYLWNCSDAVPNWNTTMPMQTVTTTYYASLTINTSSHTFSLNPGDNNITVTEGSISLTITSNANFNVQAYGADLVSGSYSIPVGNLLMSQSSLASAVNMTVSYQNIPGLTNQASGSNLSKSFVLWLSCPLGTRALTYTYTLHVRVVIAS
jgi:hypothetical protein